MQIVFWKVVTPLDIKGYPRPEKGIDPEHPPVLVQEDFPGVTLQELLERKTLDLRSFLKIGIKVTASLSLLHDNNLVYKNIHPGSIMVSSDLEMVKLMDFSLASCSSPSLYISPEQTGRINRQIDSRTDLYSLGILFYHLLSGQPPFNSEDPLEIVYAHLAREVPSLHQLNPNIPAVLSDIIQKLMRKKMEDRYQTAYALQGDLETCQNLLCLQNNAEHIRPFEIAQNDKPKNFEIPNQLYGREKEFETLEQVYQRVKDGSREILFVSGCSGVGKTSFVQDFSRYIRERNGTFSTGKFDQYKNNVPYTAFIQAFQTILKGLLSESESVVVRWKEKMLNALQPNAQLLVDIIPELELIIGSQPPVPHLAPTEAQNRFDLVFLRFIQQFASSEKPLVFFLDDLQWADLSSVRLIEQLVFDGDKQYIMIIGAYRDNEIDATHPIQLLFYKLKKAGLDAPIVSLNPLELTHINLLLSNTLNCPPRESLPLAQVCLEKTKGNPFFLIQFLYMLKEEGLLRLETRHQKWGWDLPMILSQNVTENVIDLMIAKIGKLPLPTVEILTLAACIGNNFEACTLEIVSETNVRVSEEILADLVDRGLIMQNNDQYNFLHDRVQQAAYSLLDEATKLTTHYKIGKLFYEKWAGQEQEKRLFEITDHLNLAINLIKDSSERYMLADLNLRAGKKAKGSSAYERAFEYFSLGKSLCEEGAWLTQYQLRLELHIELAEMAYVCTKFERMEQVAAETLLHCPDVLDQARIYEIMIATYTAQNELEKVLAVSQTILELLGVRFPKQPRLWQVALEYLKTSWALQGKQIEDLLNLPLMTDEKYITIMRILNSTGIGSYSASYNTIILIVLKALRISLKYGITAETIVAYSGYGYIINMLLNKAEKGYEFGQLALKLQDKLGVKRFDSKIRMMFNMMIRHGKDPLRKTLTDFPETYLSGFASGDLLSAGHSIMQYFVYSYFSGRELTTIEKEMEEHRNAMLKTGHETSIRLCELYRQTSLNFAGITKDPCVLIGDHFDERTLLPVYTKSNDRTLVFNIYFHRLIQYFYFHQPEKALENLPYVEDYLDGVLGTFCMPLVHFYGTLVLAANFEGLTIYERGRSRIKIKQSIRTLKRLSQSSPENILNKLYLLKAEKARLDRDHFNAGSFYDLAIKYAGTNQFIQEEALANELAASFYRSIGRDETAKFYLHQALACYQLWGAQAKVKDLSKRYAKLLENEPHRRPLPADLPDMDLSTIIKISQAISSEIVLEELLKLLIKIMLQNSGARTVVFIMNYDHKLTIEAEGNAEDNSIRLLQSLDLDPESTDLPIKLINYVVRTGETMTLDGDQHEASVLCLPVIIKGKVIGLFYLENKLAPGIFTRERLHVLQLLSSQIAVALENAKQYKNLERTIEEHTKKLREKNLALSESNLKLEEANQNKTRFVANVSHEIRTPLQGIMGLTSLLKKDRQYNGDYVGLIQSSAESLLRIINDILDISRMESNRWVIEERAFNLRGLLAPIVANYETQARDKGLDLISTISPDLPKYLMGDPLRISQILHNLLNNALKFTHHGQVEFSASVQAEDEMRVDVQWIIKDTGIGIPQAKLQSIFASFSQVDNSISKKYGGTGLGLTIVKRLVELMQGHIEVESKEEQGSTFRCLLPLRRATQQEIAVTEERFDFDDHEQDDLQCLKVIAAEDNLANQMYIKHILAYHNCDVTLVNNGYELVQALKLQEYDCILLDKNMPIMDGLETTRVIRALEASTGKHIPIIALTASAILGDREKLLEQGMDYYLDKPIQEKKLISILQQIRRSLEFMQETPERETLEPSREVKASLKGDRLVDMKVLRQEAELFGRDVMLFNIEDFLRNHETWMDDIRTDLEACDPDKLEKSAHRLVSALSCLYAMEVFRLAGELEREAQKRAWPEAKQHYLELTDLMGRLIGELQIIKADLGSDNLRF